MPREIARAALGTGHQMRRRATAQLVLAIVAIAAAGAAITLAILGRYQPSRASTQSNRVDALFLALSITSAVVFAVVMAVVVVAVLNFRAKPGDQSDGPPVHGNTRLEVVWTVIPALIIAVAGAYGWIVLVKDEKRPADRLVVNVYAQRFAWSYGYPQQGVKRSTQLVLPEGRTVEFRMRSKDVIHSFWVPDFRIKKDAVPGIVTDTLATPTRRGVFPVICAELCGLGHNTMRSKVTVVKPGRWQSWIEQQKRAVAP